MKQIIALVIFVCASYGVQAQGQCVAPNKPAPAAPASNANKTGPVATAPTDFSIMNNSDKTKTGHVAPMPTYPSAPAAKRRKN